MKGSLFILSFINIWIFLSAVQLEQVDDADLIHLLNGEKNVVALFTKSNCPECVELEIVVENIQKNLIESLDAVVVKAHDAQLISVYNPQKEPSLIFFRKGIPLIYDGEFKEFDILQMFTENIEPVVKELSDETFEHLTQASSGATTGDWFIFFYSSDCVLCQRLYAVWETVGARLRQYGTNVARVNRKGPGMQTARRFGINKSPDFLFLRQGKVYRYKTKDYTPKSFIQFARNWYRKQTQPEDVPAVRGIFDDFAENYLNFNATSSKTMLAGIVIASVTLICCLKYLCLSKTKKVIKKAK